MSDQKPIIVAGTGAVGLLAALGLFQRGFDVLLLGRHPKINSTGDARAIAISHSSQRYLQSLGLWDQLEAVASPILSVHISQKGFMGKTSLQAKEHGLSALGYVIESGAILSILEAKLTEMGIHRRDETWIDSMENGSILLNSGEVLSAEGVVLTEGTPEYWGSYFDLKLSKDDFQQSAIVTNLSFNQPNTGVAFERFTEHGPVALLPMTQGQFNLVYCTETQEAERLMSLNDDAFKAAVLKQFGWKLGHIQSLGQREVFPLIQQSLAHCVVGQCVLLGSAARHIHPVSGQGLNLAIRDVANLVNSVSQPHALSQLSSWNNDILAFQAQRLEDQARVLSSTQQLARVFTGQFNAAGHARGLALMLLDSVSPLRRRVAELGMGLFGHLPLTPNPENSSFFDEQSKR